MNILYRTISNTHINIKLTYNRYVFYQEHFYDNIYFLDTTERFVGYTNYELEIGNNIVMDNNCLSYNCSVKDVHSWFESNPGKYRVPVVKDERLVGEYYDSDSNGKCLYQRIEDNALEIAACFKEELQEWAAKKTIVVVGTDTTKVQLLCQIIPSAKQEITIYEKYDCIIDLNLCPDFRRIIKGRTINEFSMSEIIFPIIVRKMWSFVCENNINFYVFDGIRKSELNGLSSKEMQNTTKCIEEILIDDEYISSFVDTDIASRTFLADHKFDLNQLAQFVSNGIHNVLVDHSEKYLNVVNGERLTIGSPKIYDRMIHMYGPCVVFGLCVADSQTIASHLQLLLKEKKQTSVHVINHGLSYGKDLLNDMLYMMATPLAQGDVVIWFSGFTDHEIALFKEIGIKVYSLKDSVSNLHNWFLNNPFHCNSITNKNYANVMHKILSFAKYDKYSTNRVSMIEKYQLPLSYDADAILHSERLEDYIKFIRSYKVADSTVIKGCVVINANPCTKGHLHLINEALKKVDLLYVFLVQESTLGFSYLDREKMVNLELKNKKNVVLLPGGDIFTTAIGFPEYFNRSSHKVNPMKNHKIFCEKIAPTLDITVRFFGEEKDGDVTHQLNVTAKAIFPAYGIKVYIIPRLMYDGKAISAKDVRRYIKNKDYEQCRPLLSPSIYNYLLKNI